MTSLRSIDQRLRDSELRLKIALRAAHIGVWDWNLVTGDLELTPRARAIFGFAPGVAVNSRMTEAIMHSDDLAGIRAHTRSAFDPVLRDKPTSEFRIFRADTGEMRWLVANGEAIFQTVDGRTRAVRYLGTIQDITERKKTEAALAEAQRTQQLAIAAGGLALWEITLSDRKLHGSPAFNAIIGLPADMKPEIEDLARFCLPGEFERIQEVGLNAARSGEGQFEVEIRVRRTDVGVRWLMVRAEMLFDAAGKPERVLGVLMDIDDRKRNSERQSLMARELNHRVKNSLTVVQSLATQTFRADGNVRDQLKTFQGRLQALALANNVLLENDWAVFGIRPLVEEITGPYRDRNDDPISVDGEDLTLPPVANVPLALALHELCTNAAKYGALTQPGGHVDIRWTRNGKDMELIWTETGGPPAKEPDQYGFGTLLLTRVLAQQLGCVELQFLPEGLHCRMMIPLAA